MSDLVERLRKCPEFYVANKDLCNEAADEIERLREEVSYWTWVVSLLDKELLDE